MGSGALDGVISGLRGISMEIFGDDIDNVLRCVGGGKRWQRTRLEITRSEWQIGSFVPLIGTNM
jgi:hypothetical protein